MKSSKWGGRKLFLLTILKILVVAAAGFASNKKSGLPIFRRFGKGFRNVPWVPPGGDLHSEYKPSVFPKEEEDRIFIHDALKTNVLFDLSKESDEAENIKDIIPSFEKYVYDKGSILCKQGDEENAEYLYLIASGRSSVSIDGKVLPAPYGRVGPGAIVGDLALLYGSARAATVKTKSPTVVYRLHKKDFDHFMNQKSTDGEIRREKVKRQLIKIDKIIDRISGVKVKYEGDIIKPFKPSRQWLWTRWSGTVMQHAWKAAAANMAISLFSIFFFRHLNDQIFQVPITWPLGAIPDASHPLIIKLQGLFRTWRYTMSVTTLLLTFYLNKAFNLWRDIYDKGTKMKGRINDICMVLACNAERDSKGKYTDRARALIDDVAQYCRLCHAFSWAGLINRYNILLTPSGLSRMVSRGVMTQAQYDVLIGIPSGCGPQHATLMWILARIQQGMRDGVIPNDPATRSTFIQQTCALRSAVGGIENVLAAKIPLAYAHFVQILVDIFLSLAPFALYADLGIWSVIAVGILNIFFSGMNDLAKILLDPLDNADESFYKDSSVNMDVGVLIRRSNTGSTRFKIGLEELPFQYSA